MFKTLGNFSKILIALFIFTFVFIVIITRDGKLVIPEGSGVISIDEMNFEAFPLPDYAEDMLNGDYKSYFIEVEEGIKIHVLETGKGFPVFLMHGNPTSGFLYRKIAEKLPTDRVRVIMPTLVGLGFSSKIPASEHSLENHVRWINKVLVKLNLKELIYSGQDWGGPVGMGALALSPELLKGAVVMNTGFNAPMNEMDISSAHATVKTPVIGEFLLEVIFSIFEILKSTQGDPSSWTENLVKIYGKPVYDSGNAKAPLALMRMVTDGPEHPSTPELRRVENYVKALDIPVEIVWGTKDPILGQLLQNMKNNFPDAKVTETSAGHFLQEEVPEEIAEALIRVIEKVE